MREPQHLSLIKENILLAHLTSKVSFLLNKLMRKSPLPIQNLPAAWAERGELPSARQLFSQSEAVRQSVRQTESRQSVGQSY